MREKVINLITKLALEKTEKGMDYKKAIELSTQEAFEQIGITERDFVKGLLIARGQALING